MKEFKIGEKVSIISGKYKNKKGIVVKEDHPNYAGNDFILIDIEGEPYTEMLNVYDIEKCNSRIIRERLGIK